MKKNTLALALVTVMTVTSLVSFGQQDKKSEIAREKLVEAEKDLKLAKVDSAADYHAFRKEVEMKISDNQKKINELRKEKVSKDKKVDESYAKKVNTLEEKNNALKKKLAVSDKTETSMWTSFKREFNHDMNELGNAFKNLAIDNKK